MGSVHLLLGVFLLIQGFDRVMAVLGKSPQDPSVKNIEPWELFPNTYPKPTVPESDTTTLYPPPPEHWMLPNPDPVPESDTTTLYPPPPEHWMLPNTDPVPESDTTTLYPPPPEHWMLPNTDPVPESDTTTLYPPPPEDWMLPNPDPVPEVDPVDVNGDPQSTVPPSDPNYPKNHRANARRRKPSVLPDGRDVSQLGDDFIRTDGDDDWSKVVANKEEIYVLHPVQTKGNTLMYDPYTIGQVLGYIYELEEFGPQGPPDGFTITLMGKQIPKHLKRKRETSVGSAKSRRAVLVFKKKSFIGGEEEEQKPADLEKQYWRRVLRSL